MIIIDSDNKEVEISERNWQLAEPIMQKWKNTLVFDEKINKMRASNLEDITPELSAWGIPWKWN